QLQEQLSRKIGKIEYAKYVVVIPPEMVKKLQWKKGTEVKPTITGSKLTLEPN
ncbi:AbrB/MazE/SpoVT family DNA-binding domain-containing protein, partial [Candidatus Woesearchaeota archaeon]|nr:AbrB/MazE/SpoVT family DNA-binding domain-containing protein [Candidatus Woesearchaeota archaeon]